MSPAPQQIVLLGDLNRYWLRNQFPFSAGHPGSPLRADQFSTLFNPEPTATAINRDKDAVAVGSGLNEHCPY
jgi:hypothetical protein